LGIKLTVLEPGGMKTEWAGSSMEMGEVTQPYEQSVGAFLGYRDTLMQNAAEPEKVAEAIVALAGVEEPPLRVLMGKDAVAFAKSMTERQAVEDKKWEKFSMTLEM
jgi:hypothetical protein